jgi:hypothetical protein
MLPRSANLCLLFSRSGHKIGVLTRDESQIDPFRTSGCQQNAAVTSFSKILKTAWAQRQRLNAITGFGRYPA